LVRNRTVRSKLMKGMPMEGLLRILPTGLSSSFPRSPIRHRQRAFRGPQSRLKCHAARHRALFGDMRLPLWELEMSEGAPRIRRFIQGFSTSRSRPSQAFLSPIVGREKAPAQAHDMVMRIAGAIGLPIHNDPAPLRRACYPDTTSP
jgi:hypothetical protein